MARWFEVDREGLAEVAKRRGMHFIVTEPIQNAWDEASTRVDVVLEPVAKAAQVTITVTDDSPDGFLDLTDSFMMFRSSKKLKDPEKRGRFNLGEKLLLSVALEARVMSTTGSVIFDEKGRRRGRKKTEAGSILTARLKMTREELAEAEAFVPTLIPPVGLPTFFNGEQIMERVPLEYERYKIETEVEGPEGGFLYRMRETEVRAYEVLEGETPKLYEMGIPVDDVEVPWHIEVMQKIPLSVDRGSVRFGFRKDLEEKVGMLMAGRMTEEDARGGWVDQALWNMPDEESIRTIVRKRFGEDAVTADPSDPEANKKAIDAGYRVVHGGEFSGQAWKAIRRAEALKPAGQVFQGHLMETSPDGVPPIPRAEWTEAMEQMGTYISMAAEHLLGFNVKVTIWDAPTVDTEGAYFPDEKMFGLNLAHLGHSWVTTPHQESVDELVIHELAHHFAADHLTVAYYTACCKLGAKMRTFEHVISGSAYRVWSV